MSQSYLAFDARVRTFQTGYDYYHPDFELRSEQTLYYPYDCWVVVESGDYDITFSPGEIVTLLRYDYSRDVLDVAGSISVRYEGMVDIDRDGFYDGIAVSDGFATHILTDADAYLDYTPYRSVVELDRVSITGTTYTPPTSSGGSGGTIRKYIYGTTDDDRLSGGSLPDEIVGKAGDDSLRGNGGADILWGDGGRDILVGGGGNDSVYAGFGNDLVQGGRGNDDLFGGKAGDTIFGGAGRDFVEGESGRDRLFGDGGADDLYGGRGSDRLIGGGGNDWIQGEQGRDKLTGGRGADDFVFDGNASRDTITDFSGNDEIWIDSGANRMSQLSFTDTRAGLLVEFGAVDIFLKGLDRSDIDASDFVFV
ncbi:calcium-binding protein [Sulfitobacter sp. LCG007]